MTEPATFVAHPFFEELLRQFLAYQFSQLSDHSDDISLTLFDDLFGRWSSDIANQVRAWFANNTNITTSINYPRQEMTLPFVCVVNANEQESDQAYLSDNAGTQWIGQKDFKVKVGAYGKTLDTRERAMYARQVLAVPERHTTQIFVGTNDQATTLYLYMVIKALLILNKVDLDSVGGARNLKISGGDLNWQQDLLPAMTYMKQLTLNYDMDFNVPEQPKTTISGVNLSLQSFLASLEV